MTRRPLPLLHALFLFSALPIFSLSMDSAAFGADSGRAKAVYELCAACHGDHGEGKKSLEAPAIAGMPAWYVKAQIGKFRDGARGSHPDDIAGLRMRPMARTIYTESDIESISRYVSEMKPRMLEETVEGSVLAGETAYQVCASCHGANGKGMQAVNAPDLTQSNDWYLLKQLQNFKAGIRGGDPAKDATGASMRAMTATLDDKAMRDLIAYIRTLK